MALGQRVHDMLLQSPRYNGLARRFNVRWVGVGIARFYFTEDVPLIELYRLTRLVQEGVETLCQGVRARARVLTPRTVVKIRSLPVRYPDGRLKPQSELRGLIFNHLVLRNHVVEGPVSVRTNQNREDITSYTLFDNDYEVAREFHNDHVIVINGRTYDIHIVTDSLFDPTLTPEELSTRFKQNNKSLRLTEPERGHA